MITGRLKNRRLLAPPGLQTRPSLEKTRGVIFDTLGSRIDLYQFQGLDLFAGSGALGVEAYSRGVEPLCFVESGSVIRVLEKNLNAILPETAFHLVHKNGLTWLKKQPAGDRPWLILLDPPYSQGLGRKALEILCERLEEFRGAWIVLEQDAQEETIELPGIELQISKKVGKSQIDFFEIAP